MVGRSMMKRSAEEKAMRAALLEWGRHRWPRARRVEELVVAHECRIDMAFITEDHIAGIEIKSSKDTLDRLEKQVEVFLGHLPELWLAIAPKWTADRYDFGPLAYRCNTLIVDVFATPPHPVIKPTYHGRPVIDRAMTVQMLEILCRDELLSICRRKRLVQGRAGKMSFFINLIARKLTGDEIVSEVCHQLRARNAGWVADEPIPIPIALAQQPTLKLVGP